MKRTEPADVSPDKAGMNRHQQYLLLAALPLFILVALAIHYPAFNAPMYYDSVSQLESKEHFYASGDFLKVIELFPQRPVSMISFYLNYLTWGMDPFYFRLVNSVFLAMTAFIAALTVILIIEIASPACSNAFNEKLGVGLFLGLIFLVHPVQTYVVDYIWQRTALLSCFFYISALAAYTATRSGRIRSTATGYGLCSILFFLALMSKENAVTLPVILILAEIAFFREGWRRLLKRIGAFSVILLVLVGILSFLERPHGIGSESVGIFGTVAKYYDESSLTLFQLIISQCRVLFSYFVLIFVPIPSNVPLSTAHVIFSSPLESPIIVVATLVAFSIFGTGIYLLRKRPLTGLGLLFFLINLMPESLLVPQYLFFAYRATLPMFGLLLVLADCFLEILSKIRSFSGEKSYIGPLAAGLFATMVVVVMGSVTISKAKLWQDPVRF
jgi:protein O-mannosyl-transferase